VVPTFVHQALAGEPLTVAGDGSQTRSLCFVEDTVDGLLRLAASGVPGPVNIGNDRELTVLQIAELVRELTGSDSPVELVDLPTDDPKMRRPDITLAEQALGWRPRTPVREGLSRTVQWMAEQRTQQTTA
jgi:dTDP-glucose 4,6-dehydratase